MSDITERLEQYAKHAMPNYPKDICSQAKAEIDRLRTQCGGNCRYWEGRWRDEKADNERLRAALRFYSKAITLDMSSDGGAIARAALEPKP